MLLLPIILKIGFLVTFSYSSLVNESNIINTSKIEGLRINKKIYKITGR
jgi:hypothetical protein